MTPAYGKRVITIKYGEEKGGWSSAEGSRHFGISLWKYIRRNWADFRSRIFWKVGRGDRIMFWKHNWMEIGRLADVFPEIYGAVTDKEALISDYYMGEGSNVTWNIQLRRNLNDWEIENYCYMLELLYSLRLDGSEDTLLWENSKNKCFTVKSFYSSLLGGEKDDFPWQKIWNFKAPTKERFFAWCSVRRRILTLDNLKRRGFKLANRCSLCLRNEESIDHLFLHCTWSIELWSLTLILFRGSVVLSK